MRIRTGHWVVLGALGFSAVLILVGLRVAHQPPVAAGGNAPDANQFAEKSRLEVKGLALDEYDAKGKLVWRVASSGKLRADRARLSATGKDVRWELERAGGQKLTVVAPRFAADYQTKKISFPAGVDASSAAEKLKFHAGSMAYDMTRQVLTATGGVTGQFGDYDGQAAQLDLARLSTRATLTGPGTLRYQDFTLPAGQAVVNTASRRAVVTGSPRATRGEYTVAAQRIEADANTGTVRLSGGARLSRGALKAQAPTVSLDKDAAVALAGGGVTLSGEGFTAHGARLRVDGKAKQAVLSGGVRARVNLAR
jgi:lipopolysaccharide assembly outer membrane protein LptD (OstA)